MSGKETRKMQYHLKLRIFYEERNFGPGVARLMVLVRENGSLAKACRIMEMSYSKAWKIVKNAESDLGIRLFHGERGGENGGGTSLTEEGEAFLDTYLAFADEANRAVNRVFQKYYG